MATSHQLVQVVPDGDVILACANAASGGKIVHIRASSTMLSYGSSILKLMLSLKFGPTLPRDPPPILSLPEGHPHAMVLLCKALHLRIDMRKEHMSPEILLELGVVANKYDCSSALLALSHFWISHEVEKLTVDEARAKLFVASFLLGETQSFQWLGYGLQMNNSGPVGIYLEPKHRSNVLLEVLGKLNANRVILATEVMALVDGMLSNEVSGHSSLGSGCNNACQYLHFRGAAFIQKLSTVNLWPTSNIPTLSLEVLCDTLSNFTPDWTGGSSKCSGSARGPCVGHSLMDPMAITQHFKEKAEEIEQRIIRICFECVNEGNLKCAMQCNKGHRIWT